MDTPKSVNSVWITPQSILSLLKKHPTSRVPYDAELVKWQVKAGPNPGDVFYLIRLVCRSGNAKGLEFKDDGTPKDIFIYVREGVEDRVFQFLPKRVTEA